MVMDVVVKYVTKTETVYTDSHFLVSVYSYSWVYLRISDGNIFVADMNKYS